ncbi:nucleoporin Nup186/Nup192/Nup205 [Phycomyces blakesleeanus]|uniref:Nucleoporin Nup186/Nup192/Nup205 n=1 Tax=Phycomyces blakesleeanus TaxID=4837 RepID=A0ABR3AR62_PHYBL
MNEFEASSLLMKGINEAFSSETLALEAALVIYYNEREYLLTCLDVILRSAKDASVKDSIRLVFQQFATELAEESIPLNQQNNSPKATPANTSTQFTGFMTKPTTQPTAQQQQQPQPETKLTENLKKLGKEHLAEEQIYLVQILYHIGSLFWIKTGDLSSMIEALKQSHLLNATTPYLTLAIISAMSTVKYIDAQNGIYSADSIKKITALINDNTWKVVTLKQTVFFRWALLLTYIAKKHPEISSAGGITEAERETIFENAISENVFEFMSDYLLYFQQKTLTTDLLVLDFIELVPNILPKIRIREEDKASTNTTNLSERSSSKSEEKERKPSDLEMFFKLLASVYRNRTGAGIRFWSHERSCFHSFLRWATDLRVPGTVRAVYEFLGTIASGEDCAESAFNFLEQGTNRTHLTSSSLFSWGKLFAAFHFYIPLLQKNTRSNPQYFPPEEEELLITFLYLLRQVVQYSQNARSVLWNDPIMRVFDCLVEMLSCPTSIMLRASLYHTLAAFCSPWGGGGDGNGKRIAVQVWNVIEESNFPSQNKQQTMTETNTQTHYIHQYPTYLLKALEQEKKNEKCTETLAILDLLASMIHTQTRQEALSNGFTPNTPSVPSDLGQGTRTPGAGPYISLIIDNVFLELDKRTNLTKERQWELTEACLKILENSVISFDEHTKPFLEIRNIANQSHEIEILKKVVLIYMTHPGYEVIIRILTSTSLTSALFKIVQSVGENTKNKQAMRCVMRCLRIFNQIMEIQNVFVSLLVPCINALSTKLPNGNYKISDFIFMPFPSFTSLSKSMLYHPKIISEIALLINCTEEEEICLLSIRILRALSRESSYNDLEKRNVKCNTLNKDMGGIGTQLALLLKESPDAESILYAFSDQLKVDQPEVTSAEDYEYDINNIPFWQATVEPEDSYRSADTFEPQAYSSTRINIMDMFIENTIHGKPVPSVAHFLLGYYVFQPSTQNKVQAIGHQDARLVCLQAILDMMQGSLSSQDDTNINSSFVTAPSTSFEITHPLIAEKCHRIIYQLCAKKTISLPILNYLRNRDNHIYSQLKALPARIEVNANVATPVFPGLIVCSDGSKVLTDFCTLRAQLHGRAWLLKLVALDIHMAVGTKKKSSIQPLLDLLFDQEKIASNSGEYSNSFFSSRTAEIHQSLPRLVETFCSLDFTWIDALDREPPKPSVYLSQFDPKQFEFTTEEGYVLYDIRAAYRHFRRIIQHKLTPQAGLAELEAETTDRLGRLMSENHRREITHAKMHCLRAWRQVIQVVLLECFDEFSLAARKKITYTLLNNLLERIRKPAGLDQDVLENLCDIVLTLLIRSGQDNDTSGWVGLTPDSPLSDTHIRSLYQEMLQHIKIQPTTKEVQKEDTEKIALPQLSFLIHSTIN